MKRTTKARIWVAAFLLIIAAPIVILLLQPGVAGREFWRELSVALGFAGIALMGVQFIPTARLSFVANVFPVDALYTFHHRASIAGFMLALAHPLLLFAGDPNTLALLNVVTAPWRARAAVFAIAIFAILIVTSVWRERLKIGYEMWRAIHLLSAFFAAALVLFHMFRVNHYMAYPPQRIYWIIMGLVWLGSAVHVRLIRPLRLRSRPYRVVAIEPRRDDCWLLAIEPEGHDGLRFKAGQFAWLALEESPLDLQENPFSITSSAAAPRRLEFMIKEFGDFTSSLVSLRPGESVYVDGPYGTYDIDEIDAPGLALIAGGIGVTPIMSILRTMADRGDERPVVLFYANPDWESVNFRDELVTLQDRLTLQVVHVLEEPPDAWDGEEGFVTEEILDRHLPANRAELSYFICGPLPMIDAVSEAMRDLSLPLRQVHTEQFEMA
jgi:predicted ferric reductase